MMHTFFTVSVFVASGFAQSTLDSGFPTQCYSACGDVLSISDSCANSTGYDLSDDIVLAQLYLNCICLPSNSGPLNQ